MTLESGLPSKVGDDEPLVRFLTSSSHYVPTSGKPSPGAFMPSTRNWTTSVFRHGGEPLQEIQELGDLNVRAKLEPGRSIHGMAIVLAAVVRKAELDVVAVEPPLRHADIGGWDAFEKSKHKLMAAQIADGMKNTVIFKRS